MAYCLMPIERIIRSYFESRSEVAAVYLFGSRARGRHAETSDIDLAILTQSRSPENQTSLVDRILVELPRLTRKDIHPVILNTAGESLLRQIFTKGKCLVVNDPKQLSRFKMDAFVRIAEFEYHLKRIQKGFVRKTMKPQNG